MIVLNLLEGFFRGFVKLQLQDVDVVFCLDGDVHAALAGY